MNPEISSHPDYNFPAQRPSVSPERSDVSVLCVMKIGNNNKKKNDLNYPIL